MAEVTCPRCNGRGWVSTQSICTFCEGAGYIDDGTQAQVQEADMGEPHEVEEKEEGN